MRAFLCLALLAIAAPAHADSFVDVQGGITLPMGDDDWTNLVESSPKLALRIGAFPEELGGYLQADWTPYNTDAQGWSGPGTTGDISANRFRLQAGVLFHHMVSNTLVVTGRGGIGADIAHASFSANVGPIHVDDSQTDVGFGFEFAGGLWFKLGGMELGGEVAFPFSIHDKDEANSNLDFKYTSYDIDLLFGVRFLSH